VELTATNEGPAAGPVVLDEAYARVLATLIPDDPTPPHGLTVDAFHELIKRISVFNGPGPEMTRVSDHVVDGNGRSVRVRLLQPVPEPQGLMIFLGLGGWVAGNLDTWESMARKLAERTTCTTALVECRLAAQRPSPAADDVYAAARWLWDERRALGHEGLPLMVLGDGMGATLGALTVERGLSDPNGPRFALQFLICPATDAEPARLTPLDGDAYPPTVVVTAEFDPAFGDRLDVVDPLRRAGAVVAHRHYERQMHGFFSILALPLGERVFQHVVRAVRGYTARFSTPGYPPPPNIADWLERIIK